MLTWACLAGYRGLGDALKTPLIIEVKGNSLDDGPGIRSVVFFKGCPLSCVWCHNPEAKQTAMEIGFEAQECVACDTCLDTCPRDALSRDLPLFIDRGRCDLCLACIEKCPSGALSQVGRYMTVEEISATVLRDKVFFDNSGGGVTLSGGEPTLFMDFASALLHTLKASQVHTLLETCGLFDLAEFESKLLKVIDVIYFDLKIIAQEAHRKYCGTSNTVILENFCHLYARSRDAEIEVLPRIPLIPGITDTTVNLNAIAEFLSANQVTTTAVMPYHPLWREKEFKLGHQSADAEREEMRSFLARDHIENCKNLLRKEGLRVE